MDAETREMAEGTIPCKGKPPLDIRIVAGLFYASGFAGVALGLLYCTGVMEPKMPSRLPLGAGVLTSGLAQGIYYFLAGLCFLFFYWGLMRGKRLVWWLVMAFSASYFVHSALQFPRYPRLLAFAAVLHILTMACLWFRREFYRVTLAASGARK